MHALDVARIIAATGLPGGELLAAAGSPPSLERESLSLVKRHRIQGLADEALAVGDVTAEAWMSDELSASIATYAAARDRIMSTGAEAIAALDAAGVDHRVLKGLAISRLDFADASQRVFADADILIRRDDHASAVRALTAAGFTIEQPGVWSWWEHRYGKSVVFRSPHGVELDLHLMLTGGYFGRTIDHDRLWAQHQPLDLDGTPARALSPEGRLLHACCHVVLGRGSGLKSVRDVAQLILVTGADWQAVIDWATTDGTEIVVASAVGATWRDLGLDHTHPIVAWAANYQPDSRQLAAFEGYRRSITGTGWSAEGRTNLAALSPPDRLLFLAGLAWPSRDNLDARGLTRWSHLRGLRSRAE